MNRLIVTPSIFFQYSVCPYWIWLDIYGDQSKKGKISEFSQRLREEGVLHEKDYIRHLDFTDVVSIDFDEAEAITLDLMKKETPLIYQGAIKIESEGVIYRGRPDLLEKREGNSILGNWFYAPIDIKNSSSLKPTHLMQLVLYSIILEKIQGVFPDDVAIVNRDSERMRHLITEKDRAETLARIDSILKIMRGKRPPLTLTSGCRQNNPWTDECLKAAEEKNDIALIYNFDSRAYPDLRANGINSVSDLATAELEALPKIRFASAETLKKKQLQAQSLMKKRVIPLMPVDIEDASLKLYFDIEGDPWLNIEYLFGFWIVGDGRDPEYKYFMAEKPEDEGHMWQEFLLWIKSLPQNYKVYHYHRYEVTKLKELSSRYSTISELANFERNMIDLAKIVQDSVVFPLYFYSIKDIAKYLGFKWHHEKAGGSQSILWYEEWLEKKDPEVLKNLVQYNEDDVRAIEFLHRWFIETYPTI